MPFKTYVPPQEDPNNDWTDTLTTKVMPIAGGAIGAYVSGGSPQGAIAGYGIGSALGGMFNPKKGSELQTAAGANTALQGWQGYNKEQERLPHGSPQTGSGQKPMLAPGSLNSDTPEGAELKSFWASKGYRPEPQDDDVLTKEFGSGLSNKYNLR